MIYAEGARWADGQYAATTAAYFSDIDNDGFQEAILHNDRLFAVFEATGGRCTHLFVKGPGYVDTAIGIDNAYWSGTTADFNDDNHVAAFSDVGPNYQHQPYDLEILDDDASDGGGHAAGHVLGSEQGDLSAHRRSLAGSRVPRGGHPALGPEWMVTFPGRPGLERRHAASVVRLQLCLHGPA